MMELLDAMMAVAAPERLDQWREMYPRFRGWEPQLTRFDAMGMLFLAGEFAGGAWCVPEEAWANGVYEALNFPWDQMYITNDLVAGTDAEGPRFSLPGMGDEICLDVAALYFNLSRSSPLSGEFPFPLDPQTQSFPADDAPSYADGALAVARLMAIATADACVPEPWILTPELIELANSRPDVTAEDHPRWTGFIVDAHWDYNTASVENLHHIADWGFNSMRVNLNWRMLFRDGDVEAPRMDAFRGLDQLVAAAVERDVHLNVNIYMLPGREIEYVDDDYHFEGALDLYVNPEQQAKADVIFRTLASRYRDIPSRNLSFTPLWEALGGNNGTGVDVPDFTPADVGAYLVREVAVIHGEDPDRLIIYEPSPSQEDPNESLLWDDVCAAAEGLDNLLISYNYAEFLYVYRRIPWDTALNSDDQRHSHVVNEYPVYIYGAADSISRDAPLTFLDFLPAGTRFDIFLRYSAGDTLHVEVDGRPSADFFLEAGEFVSDMPRFAVDTFAEGERCVSYTLDREASEVTLRTDGDGLCWCGIRVTYPEEYAVEKWYHSSRYDAYLGKEEQWGYSLRPIHTVELSPYGNGGRRVTLNRDMTFTNEWFVEASDAGTVAMHCDQYVTYNGGSGNCVVRFEGVSITDWASMSAYYEDILSAFDQRGFSWWSNDFEWMTDAWGLSDKLADAPIVSFDGFDTINLELLRLLQKHQAWEQYETLAEGDRGEAVRALQQALIDGGWLEGSPDGSYGPRTAAAVSAVQEALGLPPDGVASAHFQARLFGDLKA